MRPAGAPGGRAAGWSAGGNKRSGGRSVPGRGRGRLGHRVRGHLRPAPGGGDEPDHQDERHRGQAGPVAPVHIRFGVPPSEKPMHDRQRPGQIGGDMQGTPGRRPPGEPAAGDTGGEDHAAPGRRRACRGRGTVSGRSPGRARPCRPGASDAPVPPSARELPGIPPRPGRVHGAPPATSPGRRGSSRCGPSRPAPPPPRLSGRSARIRPSTRAQSAVPRRGSPGPWRCREQLPRRRRRRAQPRSGSSARAAGGQFRPPASRAPTSS